MSSVWVPIVVDPEGLPSLPGAQENADGQPANTIEAPEGFDPLAPGSIFELLPRDGVDVYRRERGATTILQAFTLRLALTARSRSRVLVRDMPYEASKGAESLELGTISVASCTESAIEGVPQQVFAYGWDSTFETPLSDLSHISVYYRKHTYQTIYTAAEILAAGISGQVAFTRLQWKVVTAVPAANSILGMNVRLFNTTAANGAALASPVAGTAKTTVYADPADSAFVEAESTGPLTLDFEDEFLWDGESNVCVETCTSQNESTWAEAGTLVAVEAVNGGRYEADDNAGNACETLTPNSTTGYKISAKLVAGARVKTLSIGTKAGIKVFETVASVQSIAYTGTSATKTIAGLGLDAGLIWIRPPWPGYWVFADYVSGGGKFVYWAPLFDNPGEQTDASVVATISGPSFSLGSSSIANDAGQAYRAYVFGKGTAPALSGGTGTISSTYVKNDSIRYSVVDYVGNGQAAATVSHGLGQVPDIFWVIPMDYSSYSLVYCGGSIIGGSGYHLQAAGAGSTQSGGTVYSEVTSEIVKFGSNLDYTNASGGNYRIVAFAANEGVSHFESVTYAGSDISIATLFAPKFAILKVVNDSGQNDSLWYVFDAGDPEGTSSTFIETDFGSNTAFQSSPWVLFENDGIKIRNGSPFAQNTASGSSTPRQFIALIFGGAARSTTLASPGSFTADGQAAGSRRNYRLQAALGEYVGEGGSASLQYQRLPFLLAPGALELQGQGVEFFQGILTSMAGESVSYQLEGQAATLMPARRLSADAGAFTASGQSAELKTLAVYFTQLAYVGDGGTQTISVGFQPALLFIKEAHTSDALGPLVFDQARGSTLYWQTSATSTQTTSTSGVTSFASGGFVLGSTTTLNRSGSAYRAFAWKQGSANVTNTNGARTSTVAANNQAGYSAFTYTAGGTNTTVGHGLSGTPELVIIKKRTGSTLRAACVGSDLVGTNKHMVLNTTAAAVTNTVAYQSSNATQILIGLDAFVNDFGSTYVGYAFRSMPGVSKIGTFSGDGLGALTVQLDFRPAFLMVKNHNTTGSWFIAFMDSGTTGTAHQIFANATTDPASGSIVFNASSFTIPANGPGNTTGGAQAIYMAYASGG